LLRCIDSGVYISDAAYLMNLYRMAFPSVKMREAGIKNNSQLQKTLNDV